ncbi:MAG: formylglycine-generating enzyme family protein [Firmicutes bacterium]|nr:formylglycine-generating enzyme family protein [Bacillota bacterium]
MGDYLAKKDYPRLLAKLVRQEPNRWREAVLLAGAKAAEMPFALWGLVEALLAKPLPNENALAGDWGALIAGQLIAESANLSDLSPADQAKLEEIRQRQAQIMEQGKLPAVERATAGRVLGLIGDPRKAVTTLDEMEFCLVPAGEFWLGDNPPLKYNLNYDYWIARFPVTVAQFHAYIKDSGNKPRYKDSLKDSSNCPVRLVSWYDAVKFCDWVTNIWQTKGLLRNGWMIRLPSEAEWEKAARGGILIPEQPVIAKLPLASDSPVLRNNPLPQRKYPWGDEIDVDRANYNETGIGDTSAVGCFHKGVSPYGVLELSGNVWEWTRSVYAKYPYDPNDGREDLNSKDVRVLRGGSWDVQAEYLRSSYRVRDYPDIRSNLIGFRLVFVARTL